MESMLHGFQYDLSSISAEIQSLQEQSVAMNVKLKNRQAIKGELSQLVDEMVVPELMITWVLRYSLILIHQLVVLLTNNLDLRLGNYLF